MKSKIHLRLFIFATCFWVLFFLAGLPDYYLQYSAKSVMLYDILLIIPFSLIIWFTLRPVKASRRIRISIWYSFYFTVPLAIYDYTYCGIYLGYGFNFIYVFWFASIYYIIPWILFPVIATVLNYNSEKI